jgi:Ca2+-binding EF-hand superfamily protein
MADKKGKKRATRATSNVFAMFEQSQVQEFKEAFGLMDQDRDGTISVDDLKEVYNSLGRVPKDSDLKSMVEEASGPINFTMLLTLFGERLSGTDDESVLMNAFKLFDPSNQGFLHKDALREILTGEGKKEERLDDKEFNQVLEGAPVDNKGNLDYTTFTRIIKRGKQDDE